MSILTKIFGDPNKKYLNKLQPLVLKISQLEPDFEKLDDAALRDKTEEFKKRLEQGASLDDLLPEAFAAVRETAKRTLKQRHFDVQLLGGIVLHRGGIAEMKTGEGKTLVATLPAYLNGLAGRGVHIVTVNDYLAKRDTVWMGQIYHALGLSVGCITHEQAYLYDPTYSQISNIPGLASARPRAGQFPISKQNSNDQNSDSPSPYPLTQGGEGLDGKASSAGGEGSGLGGFKVVQEFLRPVERQDAYAADILYGTNNEYGFDYLRDNMVTESDQMVQREHYFAIIDEVDSILIDEARTPLIISAPAEESEELYYKFASLATRLKENEDYNIDEKMRAATLSEAGIAKFEKWLGVENLYDAGGLNLVHHAEQALRAAALYKLDRDYVVKNGEVIIVDEFTGRLMPGRRWSEGLHQAVEAKEGVKIERESQTLATVTFQNYFRLYKKLSGMTGTALTEAEEFYKIYKLEVAAIPTNKPMARTNLSDRVYKNEMGKLKAVAEEIKTRYQKGQPVLVGTISIEKNEILSQLLEREAVPHKLLNAKNHEKEAEIIAQAGRLGAVTVATNMAGRGVDIILGGNPPLAEEAKKVRELGGLHVLGTERHEARRIDNQLRGRSGRQGDPGSSQFYVSLEDDLMRIFAGDRVKGLMERFHIPDDMPIENRLVSRSIESAQNKVEQHNFDIRKHLLDYDDVLNKHRETIYKRRLEVLMNVFSHPNTKYFQTSKYGSICALEKEKAEEDRGLREQILEMIEHEIEQIVLFHTSSEDESQWNLKEVYEVCATIFPITESDRINLEGLRQEAGDKVQDIESRTKIIQYLKELAVRQYEEMEKRIIETTKDAGIMPRIEKGICLRAIDMLWVEHLDAIEHLRRGIGLRGYGQRDPLVEYKKEAYRMFTGLLNFIEKQIVYSIYKIGIASQMAPSLLQRRGISVTAPSKTMERGRNLSAAPEEPGAGKAPVTEYRQYPKVGRNEPCPCGARTSDGRQMKYKKCHGK